MEKLSVGYIGYGSIARHRHIKELSEHPKVHMAAFCDIVLKRAEEFSKRYGGEVFTDYHQLLARPDIDAVFVLCCNNRHASITIDALNAGKHVLCEKPMSGTVADCEAMLAAAKKNGKTLMIGHNQRMTPAHVKAREIIASQKYGRVISFRTTFGHTGCENFSEDGLATWLFRKDTALIGTMADLGVHKADLIRFLLGEEIIEVSAFVDTLAKKNHLGQIIEVEDNALCILRSQSGVLGSLTASWTYEEEDNSTTIYMEKAVMHLLSNPEHDLILSFRDGSRETFNLGGVQTNNNQSIKSGIPEEFVNSLLEERLPSILPADGKAAIRIVTACIESSRTGRVVRIEEV